MDQKSEKKKTLWKKCSDRYAALAERHRKEKWKRKFLSYHKDTDDAEIQEMVAYIQKTGQFNMINCELQIDYTELGTPLFYCSEKKKLYLIEGGHRLYFSAKQDKSHAMSLYRSLKQEQDVNSPHRYIDDIDMERIKAAKNAGKRVVIYELGAMEGMFSLNLIEYADEVHIFECDREWEEALKCTFEPWIDKVRIVNQYVSDHSDETHICIDDYCERNLSDTLLIVKMDIEGNERLALNGMKHTLERADDFLCFVCAYHRQDDEKVIREFFEGYKIRNTKGYFCFHSADDYDVPYVRRCLLKISKQ